MLIYLTYVMSLLVFSYAKVYVSKNMRKMPMASFLTLLGIVAKATCVVTEFYTTCFNMKVRLQKVQLYVWRCKLC